MGKTTKFLMKETKELNKQGYSMAMNGKTQCQDV